MGKKAEDKGMNIQFWETYGPSKHVRVGWITAVALGVWLGLTFASCEQDNSPEAISKFTYGLQKGTDT